MKRKLTSRQAREAALDNIGWSRWDPVVGDWLVRLNDARDIWDKAIRFSRISTEHWRRWKRLVPGLKTATAHRLGL
jgi:hypothetical protein